MSRQFLIDGYNVIKRVPALAALCDRSLEDGRAGLFRFIREYRPQGRGGNDVTIVFDGQPGHCFSDMPQDLRVIFTPGTSADDHIRQQVEEAGDPRRIICVTDDRELALACRHRGAEVWSVAQFIGKAHKVPVVHGKAGRQDVDGKVISQVVAQRIDKEFSALWLRETA